MALLFGLIFQAASTSASPFQGSRLAVSGPSPYLPAIAREIHQEGGHAADMAIALTLSLTVTHPYYASLGAGGFAMIRGARRRGAEAEGGRTIEAFDFREAAPLKISPDFYPQSGLSSQKGGAAVGAPGLIQGLLALHKAYGKLPWRRLAEPAIRLAKKGFPVSGNWAEETLKAKDKFNSHGRKVFFKKAGAPFKPGETFKYPSLARALQLVKKQKFEPLWKDMAQTSQQSQGVLSFEDMRGYKARRLKPLCFEVREFRICGFPPPSSSGIILQRAFFMARERKLSQKALFSAESLHLSAEIMARAFRPRSLMGDSLAGSSDKAQDKALSAARERFLSPLDLKRLSQSISDKKTSSPPPRRRFSGRQESTETTHFSIITAQGDAAAVTLTLNGSYGSYLVTQKYGITLNNQMDDFTAFPGKPNMYGLIQGHENAPRPGRRPLSSMSPSILERRGAQLKSAQHRGAAGRQGARSGGQLFAAIGGAGGPFIISGVFQTLMRLFYHDMDIQEAINSPRVHHQFLPKKLFVEERGFSPEALFRLKAMGHRLSFRRRLGRIYAAVREENGLVSAAHDIRKEGHSGGY